MSLNELSVVATSATQYIEVQKAVRVENFQNFLVICHNLTYLMQNANELSKNIAKKVHAVVLQDMKNSIRDARTLQPREIFSTP